MNNGNYDVIVLGIGGMGAATVFELARRGRRVLGLEQFDLGHDRGSSHGQTRVIRKAYFEHPNYVPLLRRAYQRWYDLEQRQGRHLFTECGGLYIGHPTGELVSGVRRSAKEHGLTIEEVSAAEMRRRYPAFHLGEEYVGVLEPGAGFLYVEHSVVAHVEEAIRLGAELRPNEAVLSWEASATGVTVRTEGGTYSAARLIVTAGAWASRMLADLGLPLTVRRKVLLWYATADDALLRRDVFPIYMAETPQGFYYGFPVIDGNGHKLARHDGGDVVSDPARVNRDVSPADEEDVHQFLARHLPTVDGPLRHSRVCMYTLTPDEHFIIDVHPEHSNVAVAAGFSGHGFKFASVVGEVLADLAEKGKTELPIDMFRLSRFRGPGGAPPPSGPVSRRPG
jgi:sarcosine oxidase